MYLNTIKPAQGATTAKRRVGRGIGSGLGKTCGRGHKGQKSRSGGNVGTFQGGQMPVERRLPKFGFSSRVSRVSDQITLTELNKCEQDIVDLDVLKANGLINKHIKNVKLIKSGELSKKVTLKGIKATKGAKEAVESAGGSIEE